MQCVAVCRRVLQCVAVCCSVLQYVAVVVVAVCVTVRPTRSVMYVPLQVNRFAESVLLIVQYRYLQSCSGDFYSPESDPPHKIMR